MASILVVEDDPLIRKLLSAALGREQLLVDCACDGAEALALLERADYGVILLDLMMPRMDGFQLLEAMRVLGRRRPLVFVLTAYDHGRTEGLDAALVQAVVHKPFDLETLVPIVRDCALAWLAPKSDEVPREPEPIAPPPQTRSSLLPGC